jgi:glycosyltransferase involved in cell wall biosynthesis
MKILFLSDDFPPQSFGGAGISTYDFALSMKKAGQDVAVITTCRHESEAGEIDYHGLKVFKIASDYQARWRAYLSIYNPQVLRKLEKVLKKLGPDVVHINNVHFYLSYYSIKLSKRYAKKVVFTARDAMSFSFGKLETEKYLKNLDAHLTMFDQLKQARRRWNPFRNFLIRRYIGYADKLLAVSNALKVALEQNCIRNVAVMHTGIDVSEYRASYDKQRKKIIFFAGRLSDAKGARVVEKAMQIISQEMPETKLLTAGTNSQWLNREEMKKAYAASSVVIVPSICFDAFPRTVIEAMAAGRPVVGTRYGGASEAILDGVTGYVVNPFDIKNMAEKIMGLLRDEEMAERFGRAGRERVESKFNIDDKVADFLNTIKDC